MNKRQDTSLGRHSSHFRVIAIFCTEFNVQEAHSHIFLSPLKLNNVKKIILSLIFNKMLSSTLGVFFPVTANLYKLALLWKGIDEILKKKLLVCLIFFLYALDATTWKI